MAAREARETLYARPAVASVPASLGAAGDDPRTGTAGSRRMSAQSLLPQPGRLAYAACPVLTALEQQPRNSKTRLESRACHIRRHRENTSSPIAVKRKSEIALCRRVSQAL